jgi:hypothetical protein
LLSEDGSPHSGASRKIINNPIGSCCLEHRYIRSLETR